MGRKIHDRILAVALDRNRAQISVLTPEEREQFLSLPGRVHDNLAAVEGFTAKDLALHYPHAARHRKKNVTQE